MLQTLTALLFVSTLLVSPAQAQSEQNLMMVGSLRNSDVYGESGKKLGTIGTAGSKARHCVSATAKLDGRN
jgi:hypothetical protein